MSGPRCSPSPILRVWLPVLQASFHGLQLCNIGSECCEKSTLKPLGTSPFSLGAAFKLHLGVLAWVLLPVLAHLSCWSWSWPPDFVLKLECRPAASLRVRVAVTGACFTLAAVSDQLCAFCSGTVGLCPVAVRSCLCLPCHAQLRAACLSCCSLTLSLNSLQLWQPWGQFCDAD